MHYSVGVRRRSKVVTDAARDSGVPLGVDALSLAAVAHANRSPRLLRVGVATKAAFISRQEKRIEEFNSPALPVFPIFFRRLKVPAERFESSEAGFHISPDDQ